MDAWPKKILLATEGSGDVELAATTAVSLTRITGSKTGPWCVHMPDLTPL